MDFPQLLGSFYSSFSSQADCQRAMNVYCERIESGAGRGQFAMYKQFGLRPFGQFGVGQGTRGMLLDPTNSQLRTVQGATLYDIFSSGTVNSTLGPMVNDGLPVVMDQSVNSVFIVSGNVLYRNNSAALTAIATPFVPISVGVIAGLVVALEADSTDFYFSTDDGVTWNALDTQNAEAYPNRLINLVIDHQELWLFGNRRTQVFVPGQDPDAPFDAIPSGLIEMGLAAKFGVARMDNSIFWLGSNRDGDHMVWRANGYSPVRVSNHAVENAFRSYPVHEDAIMQAFQLNGHSCLRLTFPSANNGRGATWQYDASLPPDIAWTECSWWNLIQGYEERHRGAFYTSAFGKILVGDHSNGWIYELTPDEYTDFGYPIRWYRRTPHTTKENKRIRYRTFEIVPQTGVGLVNPLWLNDWRLSPSAFVTALAAEVSGGTVTAAQALVLQSIYDLKPYTPLDPYPSPDTMNTLGFYPWGAKSQLSNGTVLGSAPQLAMRYSDDGGENFGAWRHRSLGLRGTRNNRLEFYYLGMGRDRVWEIQGESPVKEAILQGTFSASVGDS